MLTLLTHLTTLATRTLHTQHACKFSPRQLLLLHYSRPTRLRYHPQPTLLISHVYVHTVPANTPCSPASNAPSSRNYTCRRGRCACACISYRCPPPTNFVPRADDKTAMKRRPRKRSAPCRCPRIIVPSAHSHAERGALHARATSPQLCGGHSPLRGLVIRMRLASGVRGLEVEVQL